MRVNSISAKNSYPIFHAKKHSSDVFAAKRDNLSRGEKITIFATSAVAVGLGIAAIALTKKNKTSSTFLKKQKMLLEKKIKKSSLKQDPAVKMLKGKRDINAVNDYKAYITKKKIESLNQKVLNNKINLDDPKVLKHVIKNKLNMEREVISLLS